MGDADGLSRYWRHPLTGALYPLNRATPTRVDGTMPRQGKATRMSKSVFYSFYYDRDVHRVQLVRNINAIEGKPALNGQEWEQVRTSSKATVVKWIAEQMSYKRAVVVLIGYETASRPWVIYEIEKAWAAKKPLLGVRIHGLSSMGSVDSPGPDPFAKADGVSRVPIFDPTVKDWFGKIDSKATYNKLAAQLPQWADQGKVKGVS